jgi:hypothetical protein
MTFDPFIGSSYVSPSAAWDAQRAFNLYPEANESGASKSPVALVGTPGLTLFGTMATTHIRGQWTGLADNLPGSTATDLCYVVAGAKLYSVASTGVGTLIGDVGDDATHSPVTFQVNGTQILISSAGLLWVYDGNNGTLGRAFFNNGLGTVDTNDFTVTWVSGDQFDATLVGSGILIGTTAYIIATFVSETEITLGATAGIQAGASYRVMAAATTVNRHNTTLHWVSGDKFTGLLAGDKIILDGTVRTVGSIIDDEEIHLSGFIVGDRFNLSMQSSAAVPASMTAFLDGYGIALAPNAKTYGISDINDFTRWNPLDFGRKSAFPDNIASVLTDHEELYLFGSETSEVWRNTGAADFPLERDPGAFMHQGIRAPFSACSLANGVAWIGGDARGNPVAWRATGFQPVRVSSHGVETAWAAYSTITDARGFVYTERGHQFWVLNFPTANATWVYDATANQWHERGWWNGTGYDRVRYATHGYCFGRHIVGDWENGKLYELSESAYTDAGTAIHRFRTAPHLSNEELWTYYNQFRLSCQPGITPTLSWSDDQGATWHAEVAASSRLIGGVSSSSVWRRLGKARDRVWRVTITDAAKVVLFAAYLDIEAGS